MNLGARVTFYRLKSVQFQLYEGPADMETLTSISESLKALAMILQPMFAFYT